jgi:hypothetical protein
MMRERDEGSGMTAQHWHWYAGALAALIAVVAGVADHRRNNRSRLEDIGWVPWRGIQVAAVFALLLVLVLALKGV